VRGTTGRMSAGVARRWAGITAAALLLGALVAASPVPAAFPGANGRIAFQSTGGLGTINVVGGDRRPLIGGNGLFAAPTWSADGRRLAFSSNSAGGAFELYVTGAEGGAITRLTTNMTEDDAPAWSPDGGRIAFESDRDGNSEVYVMNADGSGVIRLTSNVVEDRAPAWSPDGTRIAFARGVAGNADIWTMTPDGGSATPLTTDPGDETNPDWSPDGSRIVFQRGGAIVVMAANGAAQVPLPLPSGAARPAWAPDGSRILFDLNSEIYSANPDGSGVTQLTTAGTSGLIAQAPTWQPIALAGGGTAPPGLVDRDGDGVAASLDCNDADRAVHPGAKDKRDDGIDQDCSGRDARSPVLRRTVKALLNTNRGGGYSVFVSMAVKPVRQRDTLRITCTGRGCPLKRRTIHMKKNRRSLSLLNHLRGAKLRNGAVVQLRVTHKATLGRVTTWKIRAPKAARITRECLAPGKTKPTRCPR
jgi:WD40 repeat protein/putative metal-binding protein